MPDNEQKGYPSQYEKVKAITDQLEAGIQELFNSEKFRTYLTTLSKFHAAYRKAGYSKAFLEEHREEITLHKAAKAAFDELGVKTLPKIKDLSVEYAQVLSDKKQAYAEYRQIRDEVQELLIAQRNIAALLCALNS